MWCSNGQVCSSKWPRSRSAKPVKPKAPWAPSALPGDLNEGDMRQHDPIIWQKSEGLKVINLSNIMLQVSTQSIVRRNSDTQGISYPLEVWPCFMYHHVSSAVSPCASYVKANSLKWKTRTTVGFPTTSGLGKSWLEDTASSRNLLTKHKSINAAFICCPVFNKLIY